jgi:nitrogen fixation protein NifU and related proteins
MTSNAAELRDLYQELILDHGRAPRNRRKPVDANREALGHNPMCGDKMTIYLKLGERDSLIEDVAFTGEGCAISTASASMMTEILKGKTAAQAQEIFDYFHTLCTTDYATPPSHIGQDDLDRLDALSGVRNFPIRVKCATLAWHAMQAALCPAGLRQNQVTSEADEIK